MSRAMGRNREDLEAGFTDLLPPKRIIACFLSTIIVVTIFMVNMHLLADLPIWLSSGIVLMAIFILKYANCHQCRRQDEAVPNNELMGYGEDRYSLRRTRSNLPAVRFRLAQLDRDFDELDYEDLRALDEDITPVPPSTSEGDNNARYMVQSHVHTQRVQGNELACIVCLEPFNVGEHIRSLPCLHQFHIDCVDLWLREKGRCPMCKYRVGPGSHESDTDEAEYMV